MEYDMTTQKEGIQKGYISTRQKLPYFFRFLIGFLPDVHCNTSKQQVLLPTELEIHKTLSTSLPRVPFILLSLLSLVIILAPHHSSSLVMHNISMSSCRKSVCHITHSIETILPTMKWASYNGHNWLLSSYPQSSMLYLRVEKLCWLLFF